MISLTRKPQVNSNKDRLAIAPSFADIFHDSFHYSRFVVTGSGGPTSYSVPDFYWVGVFFRVLVNVISLFAKELQEN